MAKWTALAPVFVPMLMLLGYVIWQLHHWLIK
ncbi:AbgT family transporter [Anoxybacillus caldiproteolyticus]|nr:AbgT family transporter [Anoxybacillus caldiproteolyticus]